MTLHFAQKNIRLNHVAVVGRGRCGNSCRILDAATTSETENDMNIEDALRKLDSLIALLGGKTRPMPGHMAMPTMDSRTSISDGRVLSLEEQRDAVEQHDREVSFSYGAAVNEIGAQLRRGVAPHDCRSSIIDRRRAEDAKDEFGWADQINERGRQLRERR